MLTITFTSPPSSAYTYCANVETATVTRQRLKTVLEQMMHDFVEEAETLSPGERAALEVVFHNE